MFKNQLSIFRFVNSATPMLPFLNKDLVRVTTVIFLGNEFQICLSTQFIVCYSIYCKLCRFIWIIILFDKWFVT